MQPCSKYDLSSLEFVDLEEWVPDPNSRVATNWDKPVDSCEDDSSEDK